MLGVSHIVLIVSYLVSKSLVSKQVLDLVSEIFGIVICPGFGIEKQIINELYVRNMVL